MSKAIIMSSLDLGSKDPSTKAAFGLRRMTGKKQVNVLYMSPYSIWGHLQSYLVMDFQFRNLGLGRVQHVDQFDSVEAALAWADAVYIHGGNTFDMLSHFKDSGAWDAMMAVKEEKVWFGTSAGGIMLTPSIRIAQFADDNYGRLKDLDAMGLAQFHVKPHWDSWGSKLDVFKDYIQLHQVQLYGIPEGECIIIDGDNVTISDGVINVNEAKNEPMEAEELMEEEG